MLKQPKKDLRGENSRMRNKKVFLFSQFDNALLIQSVDTANKNVNPGFSDVQCEKQVRE